MGRLKENDSTYPVISPRPDKGSMGVYTELAAILRDAEGGSSIAMGLLRGVGESVEKALDGRVREF